MRGANISHTLSINVNILVLKTAEDRLQAVTLKRGETDTGPVRVTCSKVFKQFCSLT